MTLIASSLQSLKKLWVAEKDRRAFCHATKTKIRKLLPKTDVTIN
jgi:hypothetical protein